MNASPVVSQRLRASLSKTELWDLMWRPEGLTRWLGPSARVRLRPNERCAFGDEAGVWRIARIVSIRVGAQLTLAMEPAVGWAGVTETQVTITLSERGDAACEVLVEEAGLPGAQVAVCSAYWSGRLARLTTLVRQVRDRRSSPRQAVIVIHGIGEQQPGETLAALATSGVLSASESEGRWVKPDRVSGSYELHRITFEGTAKRPTTDAFEFYWAHVIRDTSLSQLASWLRGLLLRWSVPFPLQPVWCVLWLAVVVAAGVMVASLTGKLAVPVWLTGGSLAVMAGLAWRFVGHGLAVDVLGDAARYLTPLPANVAHRQAIRQAGVELVLRLHASGHYDRVVILGHSLGSVIAYDILTHAWVALHQRHRRPTRPKFGDLIAVERASAVAAPADSGERQAAAWRQQRANTQPWLITDLVTVGSPLTYGDFLMAPSRKAFARAKTDRVLPSCPPETELEARSGHQRITFDFPYRDVHTGQAHTFTVLHHAAPFAVTRWTNLFFKVEGPGLKGDIIGGPVAPCFGTWVSDQEMVSPTWAPAHTSYWRPVSGRDEHLRKLRAALRLDARAELEETLAAMPAFALLPEPEGRDDG